MTQPLRRLGTVQPLCGTGVTSLIDVTSMPVFWIAAHGGVAAGAGALHVHLDPARPCSMAALARPLGGLLGGEGRALAAALEADRAGRRPGDDVAVRVGDRHDRVVERALDVHDTGRDVLAVTLAGAAAARLWLRHCVTSSQPSSCWQRCASGPYGCGRWCGCAGHGPAAPCGDGCPAGSRSRSCA